MNCEGQKREEEKMRKKKDKPLEKSSSHVVSRESFRLLHDDRALVETGQFGGPKEGKTRIRLLFIPAAPADDLEADSPIGFARPLYCASIFVTPNELHYDLLMQM